MSSCLSSRACGFDLEQMIKWPCSTSGRTTSNSNSSSPSSTLSESGDSPTRKPRTPRKRPNQTYNEAAALLSMACPNVFTTIHLTNRTTNYLPKHHHHSFFNKPPELILPFPVIESSGFLLRQQTTDKPCSITDPNVVNSCRVSEEFESTSVYDFDTESMLDEEMEQGIDSIMGDSNSNSITEIDESNDLIASRFDACYGYPIGLGFGGDSEMNFGVLMRNGERALRKGNDERNLSSFPAVKMVDVSPPPPPPPKPEKSPVGNKKKKNKKKKKVEELMKSEFRNCNSGDESLSYGIGIGNRLMLKLDYEGVMDAWSEKGSPMSEETPQSRSPQADIHAIAAQIDLLSENGGMMESGATRSTDSNHSKKIRYQVKNASSDGRSRCKGRFVTKSNSPTSDEET